MAQVEYIRREEMTEALAGERVERRRELRRTQDRLDRLELEQQHGKEEHLRLDKIVRGEHGNNGMSADVRELKTLVSRNERILWILLAAVVGTAARTFT